MSHRTSRIPGTAKRTLLVLPAIPDDAPAELKNAIALRNACVTEGQCPGCGVIGVVTPDPKLEATFHYTFRHENWCGALTDEQAA